MKINYSISFLAALLGLVSGCTPEQERATPQAAVQKLPLPADVGQKSAFSLTLFKACAKEQRQGNVILSPASTAYALNLLRPGARGETKINIDRNLGSCTLASLDQCIKQSGLRLDSANRAFIEKDFVLQPQYLNSLPKGSCESLDFASPETAAGHMNKWVSQKTQGLIQNLISPEQLDDARLVLANALCLNAKWAIPFEAGDTRSHEFTKANGKKSQVQMMSVEADFRYYETARYEAIALAYKKEGKSSTSPVHFVAILPKATGSARPWLNSSSPEEWEKMRAGLAQAPKSRVFLKMPRLDLGSETLSLRKPLEALGLGELFLETGDLSGIAPNLMLGEALQQCSLKVDEVGTVAAAATALIMKPYCIQPQRKFLAFDRPFVWLVGELQSTTPPYFMGLVDEL